ncbi:vesicle-associated protein 2-1-like isoform X1 [Salvia hispanica]|uniref:vesicle-associated protein 2-1-like isoform X1 n=1 Tax=Salvia hispanica TaxID=49212 RepID=UPI002009401A|nr:vesicle-associated protein 2-1-like isoform X1 [Salvia hispanica]
MSISEKLLLIEPQELTFCFELMKNASCGIRLCSNSSRHVAFKVMTTSPEKYFVKPNNGILSPGTTCHVEVIMRAPEEVPPNMECKDKFLIKSVLASPDDTVARTQKLFNNRAHAVGDYKLRVVYVLPQQQQRSGGGSSINGQILKKRSSNSTKLGWLGDNLYMKAISVLFLSLIFLYLIMRILPVIWSWMFVVTFFVIKMAKRLVSDSVEDWVVKTLVYICLHFFTVVFQRKRSRSGLETQVPVG